MNLLLTGCFDYSESQLETLRILGYTTFYMEREDGNLPLPPENVDAVVCNGLFLHHTIEEFATLKLIQLTSAGLDRIPVDKIEKRGIKLFNARGVYSIPMAEWAVFRVLEYYKQGWYFRQEQSSERWEKHRGLREVYGARVAIVGAGNVGQEVARRFQAFGAETVGFDIHTRETPGFTQMALIKSLGTRIGEFDIVIVTAPLLPSTRGLISRDILTALKKNAVLVNIARGGLIDEGALCEILSARRDLFAALDVFETEPLPSGSPLWKLENVAVSPHNSFVGNGNKERMFRVIEENLKTFIVERGN